MGGFIKTCSKNTKVDVESASEWYRISDDIYTSYLTLHPTTFESPLIDASIEASLGLASCCIKLENEHIAAAAIDSYEKKIKSRVMGRGSGEVKNGVKFNIPGLTMLKFKLEMRRKKTHKIP